MCKKKKKNDDKNKKYIRNLASVFKHIKTLQYGSLFDFMYTYLHLQYPDCSP